MRLYLWLKCKSILIEINLHLTGQHKCPDFYIFIVDIIMRLYLWLKCKSI
jgi:hypothetical protein